ncbi:MAG TPA: T9SS type A sorting domain-containing protein [Puia sp.]|nr:T9SS type A sorting domain-containing protein [Puia sp.]
MKRFLLITLTLVGLATGKLFAQSFSNSATPNAVMLSSSPTTVSLSSVISGSYNSGNTNYAFSSSTSWTGPGSGITVGATSITGNNETAGATATLPANLPVGTYTFTLNYATNRSGHSGSQTVTVTVAHPSVSLSPSPVTITPGSVSLTASASGFTGSSGSYGYSWSASPSTGVTLPGNSSSASGSISFANTGTYIITATVTRGTATASANDTVYVVTSGTKPYNSPVYSANIQGGHLMIGNTIMKSNSYSDKSNSSSNTGTIMNYFNIASDGTTSIYGNDNSDMEFVNIDNGATSGIVSSSAANLTLPSGSNTIKFARLYWGGHLTPDDFSGSNLTSVKIKFGTNAYQSVSIPASQVNAITVSSNSYAYQSYADITNYIQNNGTGTYTVANIPSSTGDDIKNLDGGGYGGWSIVVAYENTSMSYYSVRIYDAFLFVESQSAAQTLTLTNLNAPNNTLAAADAYLSTFAWEGDANLAAAPSNAAGDYLKINGVTYSDAVNPATNMWNGTISNYGSLVTTSNPNYKNQMGIDIDNINVGDVYGITPNATSATVTFGTEQDQYYPSVFAFSIKMKDPLVTINKTVVGSKAPTTTLQSNETLTYTITGANTGQGILSNAVIVDSLPAGISYVPGSMMVYSYATNSWMTQTDTKDNDYSCFTTTSGGTQYLTFYMGKGATGTTGGVLNSGDQYKVQFQATTPSDINALSTVSNTAYVIGIGSQTGNLSTTLTNQSTAIISPANDLPVTLLSFNASKSNNAAQLTWETTYEKDNNHFDIERSTDGVNFIKVGMIAGNETSTLIHNYDYADDITGLSGIVYYRLKDVDDDGHFGYSKIVPLRLDGSSMTANFSAYPNPFASNIKLLITSLSTKNANVNLLNTAGQRIASQLVQLQNGQNVVVLQNLSTLQAGIYVVELVTEDGKNYQKIVKQ